MEFAVSLRRSFSVFSAISLKNAHHFLSFCVNQIAGGHKSVVLHGWSQFSISNGLVWITCLDFWLVCSYGRPNKARIVKTLERSFSGAKLSQLLNIKVVIEVQTHWPQNDPFRAWRNKWMIYKWMKITWSSELRPASYTACQKSGKLYFIMCCVTGMRMVCRAQRFSHY